MTDVEYVPLGDRYDPGQPPAEAARWFHDAMCTRRSVRAFSDRDVDRETIEWIVRAATTAPSGANKQPWRFVAVRDPETKRRIRLAAEAEERELYERRASAAWLEDLKPLGTNAVKEYLEVAPWLIVVFKLTAADDGGRTYYADESVGIATGLLLAAAHMAGLSTLTHTPSPMRFLGELLDRPANERAYMLIPVGYPAEDCRVPAHALHRRPLEESLIVV